MDKAVAILVVVVNQDCVGCGEDRECGNDRHWRGMKSVWRMTVSSQI